ncbi:MAG TPA: SCP2 sterol-binding domain-containing protein [Rudaea sp.]|nr:SCP2 sterol-binding domain-containing protein [Rudaea sp.]
MPARFEQSHLMAEDRQPNPLLAALGRALEAALNRGVTLDADMRSQLARLEGRRIGVELRGANLALAITVRAGRLRVGPHWEAPGDLNLHASPGSLLAFALRRGDEAGKTPAGKVEISGDAELARRVEKLLRGFRPDIEEAFARTFGDVLGVPLARALHSAFAWTRESAQSFAEDSAAFLRDDTRDLVAPAEVDALLDEIDALRERADRLAARVQRVATKIGGGGT